MGVEPYLQLICTWSLDRAINSLQKLPGVDDEKRESLLHNLLLHLIVDLTVPQLFYLFCDGFLQQHLALEQSRVEPPELICGVQLGGRRRDGHEAAV